MISAQTCADPCLVVADPEPPVQPPPAVLVRPRVPQLVLPPVELAERLLGPVLEAIVCIKIGLPGKSILRDYFQENMIS